MALDEENSSDSVSFKTFQGYVLWWNNTYPIDRWWRIRHSIPFMSPVHKSACLIDMRFEFEEEKLLKRLHKISERRKRDLEEAELTGRILKKRRSGGVVSEDEFDDIDLTKIGEDGSIKI